MRILGFHTSWFRRRWWVLVASTLGVAALALVLQPPTTSAATGEAVLIVRSGATTNTPGNANEANRLAVTYANLIPQDTQVLERVARTLNRPIGEVERHVSAVNDANTSILRVRYTSDDGQTAVNGARAIADALAGPTPASSNFNGVGLSRLPDKAMGTSDASSNLPVALLLGLFLGLVLVVAWERTNGRIDDRLDVEHECDCPVSDLDQLTSSAILALLARWSELADRPKMGVAIISTEVGHLDLVDDIAGVLDATATRVQSDFDISFLTAGAPGTPETGERTAQRADVVAIVVPYGARLTSVRASLEALATFGVTPVWALYASKALQERTAVRVAEAGAVEHSKPDVDLTEGASKPG